jgi:uncharacterized membrane protein YciS (DUF1049 family)
MGLNNLVLSERKLKIIYARIFSITIIMLLLFSVNCSAEVSRQITFNMLEENDFRLIKSRTYTQNEISMLRKQLDSQFGNSDGYLNQNEVDAFSASYDNYFEQTNYIIVAEIQIIKENVTLNFSNLVGSTSDNQTIITTTFTFEGKSPHLPESLEHYIKFNRELWKYVDLEGKGQYTSDNNFTFIAPEGWTITYTRGLGNHSFSSDNRTLSANVNLDFEWATVKITKDTEDNGVTNGNNQVSDDNTLIFVLIFIIALIILGVLIAVALKSTRTKERLKTEIDESAALSDEELEELKSKKKKIREDILKVRSDLRMDVITKDSARSKEKVLKEKLREVEASLKSTK